VSNSAPSAAVGPAASIHASLSGLSLLLRAFQHAVDAAGDPWQFAIGISELKSRGLHNIDLAWLLNKGLAEHAIETTIPGDTKRHFRTIESRIVQPRTYYALTKNGYESLLMSMGQSPPAATLTGSSGDIAAPATGAAAPRPIELPQWDASQRELRFRGRVVKRYRVPASNQERILSAFEEESWPPGIDDPLPPDGDQDPIRRLQATIKSLNRNQLHALIRFRGNGNGDRICWDVV